MLRRARESDIQDLSSKDDSERVFDLQHASTYRIILLRTLQSNVYERTEALTTLSKLVTQWWEEYSASKQEWDGPKPAAAESHESVMTPPDEGFLRPKFSRADSFQMRFEEVFDTEHDEQVLSRIDEGTSRQSPGPLTPRTEDWLSAGENRSASPPTAIGSAQRAPGTIKGDERQPQRDPKLYFRVHFGGELEDFLKDSGVRIRCRWRDKGFIPDNARDEVISEADVQEHLKRFYIGLIRYSGDCPWKDIRVGCKAVLKKLEARHYPFSFAFAVRSNYIYEIPIYFESLDTVANTAALGADVPQLHFRGIHSPSLFINVRDTIGIDDGLKASGYGSEYADQPTSSPSASSYGSSRKDLNHAWPEDGDGSFSSRFSSIPETVGIGIGIPGAPPITSDNPRLGRKDKQNAASSFSSSKGMKRNSATHGYSGSMPAHPAYPPSVPLSPQPGLGIPLSRSRGRFRSQLKFAARIPSDAARNLHLRRFRGYGRITNLYKILSIAPQFAVAHMDVTSEVLFYNLPYLIPLDQRIYLGIMAAAEMKCQYFMTLMSEQFLQTPARGQRAWLRGLNNVPPQLRGLAKYNALLAHEPWKITKHHVQELTNLKWQWHHIIQATMILSFYHSMSAFVLACGVIPEADLPGGTVRHSENATSIARLFGLPQVPRPILATYDTNARAKEKYPGATTEPPSLSRKRQTDQHDNGQQGDPDKWLKTPHGSVPNSSNPRNSTLWDGHPSKTSATAVLTENDYKASDIAGGREMGGRRKSFDDCATNDDSLQGSELAASASAPTSYLPVTMASVPTPHRRDYLHSPCSSTSSFMNESTDHAMMQIWPMNVPIEGHEKFLHTDSVKAKVQEFDVHNSSYSFLDETDFSFRDSTNSVLGMISGHFDGLSKALDKYFKAAEHVDIENSQSFKALSQKMSPRLGFSRSSSVVNLASLTASAADSSWVPPDLCRSDSFISRFGKSKLDFGDAESEHDNDFSFDFGSDGMRTPQLGEETPLESPLGHRHSRHSSTNWTPDRGYPVKEAVWAYALRMLGYQKQSYPYRDIKILIAKSTRRFIKRLCIAPHLITLADWNGASASGELEKEEGVSMTKMTSDEKVLIAIYASQARWQGQILLALNAANDFRSMK
ncbi:MAG: Sestrin-1 [Geoglossum simile]|nr:MAG: Sestrin-1 [Geoglossum simile]